MIGRSTVLALVIGEPDPTNNRSRGQSTRSATYSRCVVVLGKVQPGKGVVLRRPEDKGEPSDAATRSAAESSSNANGEESDGLRTAPELMLDLARKAAELVVERIENLPGEHAWDGEFRQGLVDQLMENPPEAG